VSSRLRVLYVTNPFYEANGREYAGEDRDLSARLGETFDVRTCLPTEAVQLMADVEVVVVRNSGPVLTYPEAYAEFRDRALATGQPVYNELMGKADMLGKQYLLDLHAAGYPVIPTVGSADRLEDLPPSEEYVVKPLLGADSTGLYTATAEELAATDPAGVLIQPLVDIAYEVSFYFVDHTFVYALRTPDARRRWELEPYEPDSDDLTFARRFIDWNDIDHGVQRVDACRTTGGELLLVELEDLNPFLSLDRTTPQAREAFMRELTAAIRRLAEARAG
jgi:hypothetical protein